MKFSDKKLEPFGKRILDLRIPTDISYKTPIVFRVMNELYESGCIAEPEDSRIELAFDEALTNAMIHGNKFNAAKQIHIVVFHDDREWGAIIEDEGAGFSYDDIPRYDDTDALLAEKGRGIRLMDNYMDRLIYNPEGNAVMLVLQKEARAKEAPEDTAADAAKTAPTVEKASPGPAQVKSDPPVAVVKLYEQRITHETLDPVRDILVETAEKHKGLVIDMQEVTYVSSAFIGALMKIFRIIREKQGRLAPAAIQPPVRDILTSVSLDRVMKFYDDSDEALQELKKELR